MASDIETTSSGEVVKIAIVIGVAIVALVVANFLFSLVLTIVKSLVFLAILAGVVWVGYQLISSNDSSRT